MKTQNIELIGDAVNAAVLKLPTRAFPGVLIQGDSLSILHRTAERALDALTDDESAEAREHLIELHRLLTGYRAAYERAMREAGLSLPY